MRDHDPAMIRTQSRRVRGVRSAHPALVPDLEDSSMKNLSHLGLTVALLGS